jgi:hypothetical protein
MGRGNSTPALDLRRTTSPRLAVALPAGPDVRTPIRKRQRGMMGVQEHGLVWLWRFRGRTAKAKHSASTTEPLNNGNKPVQWRLSSFWNLIVSGSIWYNKKSVNFLLTFPIAPMTLLGHGESTIANPVVLFMRHFGAVSESRRRLCLQRNTGRTN